MASKTSSNFSELEKEVLSELIERRKNIIENKQNDGRMITKKSNEWNIIEKEFNSRHGVNFRSLKQLKSLWKNLKARAKTAVAKERREKKKTGGGPAENSLDKISNSISEMLPRQINSLENAYDDDASFHGDEPLENEDTNVSDEIITATSSSNDTPKTSPVTEKTSPETSVITSPETPAKCMKRKSPGLGRQDQVKHYSGYIPVNFGQSPNKWCVSRNV
ncbi:hypothetical protein FSP39_009793 [Pinctada imbricata]|uniref:Myb/SANT-like DNA-binding domain-containing protein n=1 Tax=Pinctada imbricata TaxID=66713 RepID=A0AA88XF57_PINIB|nr:hypothetical protein FSP39_009793 [Pinctada imbricata]